MSNQKIWGNTLFTVSNSCVAISYSCLPQPIQLEIHKTVLDTALYDLH